MKGLFANFIILLGLGLLIFGTYLVILRHSPQILAFDKKPDSIVSLQFENPDTIEIPSIQLRLPIVSAIAKGNNWETTNIGISYLSTSPLPGEMGNSILYGHNWEGLLGELPNVKPGDFIFITMKDGAKKSFLVEYTAIVNPSQTYIIGNTKDSRITIYTCTGFLDSKRFVVIAKPIV